MTANACLCADELKAKFAAMGVWVNVSPWTPDLLPTPYEELRMRCPHGVRWHAEPTVDQQRQWAEDGVR